MRNLSINDCGTAHEDKLLEIFNDVVYMEKKRTGKDVTPVEKNRIEMQIAEAYQTILNNLRDAGSIGQALNLLGNRISTSNASINEISKMATAVVTEVGNNYEPENENNIKDEVAAFGIAQALSFEANEAKFEKIQKDYAPGSAEEREVISRAHSEDATEHDKDMYVLLSQTEMFAFLYSMGLNYEDLDRFDKGILVKGIKTFIEDGKEEEAKVLMQKLGITREIVDDPEWNNTYYVDNTLDEEDAKISRRIKAFSDKVSKFVKYYSKLTPESRKKASDEIMQDYENSGEKIDFGLEALSEIFETNKELTDIPEIQQLLSRFEKDMEDPTVSFEPDQYMTIKMANFVNKAHNKEPQFSKKIMDGFNKRAQEEKYPILDFDNIIELDREDFDRLLLIREQKNYTYGEFIEIIKEGRIKEIELEDSSEFELENSNESKPKITNESKKVLRRPEESIQRFLNSVYESKGMQSVMDCVKKQCSTDSVAPEQKKNWLKGFSMFLDFYRDSDLEKQEDVKVIRETIKDIMFEKNNNIEPGTDLYEFVQITNKAIKGRNYEKTLNVNDSVLKEVIENVEGSENIIFKKTGNNKELPEDDEPEI